MLLGCHVHKSIHKDMHLQLLDSIEELSNIIKIGALSMFMSGPRKLMIGYTTEELVMIKKLLKISNIKMVLHAAYVAVPWSGDLKVISHIFTELIKCAKFGFVGTIIHLPNKPLSEIKPILKILSEEDKSAEGAKLFLETPPLIKPIYATPQQLGELYKELMQLNPNRFGICIDTAHIWISGIDISSYDKMQAYLDEIVEVGIDPKNVMFHLNDSIRNMNEGPDTHSKLAEGRIWGNYSKRNLKESGIAALVNFARKHNNIVIIERNKYEDIIDDFILLSFIV